MPGCLSTMLKLMHTRQAVLTDGSLLYNLSLPASAHLCQALYLRLNGRNALLLRTPLSGFQLLHDGACPIICAAAHQGAAAAIAWQLSCCILEAPAAQARRRCRAAARLLEAAPQQRFCCARICWRPAQRRTLCMGLSGGLACCLGCVYQISPRGKGVHGASVALSGHSVLPGVYLSKIPKGQGGAVRLTGVAWKVCRRSSKARHSRCSAALSLHSRALSALHPTPCASWCTSFSGFFTGCHSILDGLADQHSR